MVASAHGDAFARQMTEYGHVFAAALATVATRGRRVLETFVASGTLEGGVLKTELHTHSGEDPVDLIPYDARALIDRASALGFAVLAITLHDRQLPVDELTRYARARGIVLIPGVERTISGKHVLLLNFPSEAERIGSFGELRALKRRSNGLVIAPHPFYPHPTSLGRVIDAHADLFDAVERNAFYTRLVDFNRRAESWARRHGKPVVGNGDVHRLRQLGRTYSLIDAEPDPDSVCEAIRRGRVSVSSEPMTADEAAWLLADLLASDARRVLDRVALPRRRSHAAAAPGFDAQDAA